MPTFVESKGTVLREVDTASLAVLKTRGSEWTHRVMSAFVPEGYPKSVSDDYVRYQVFDTLQALASSCAGTLATRAVLKGVGVGDAEASVAAAAWTHVLRDASGLIGRIAFAYARGGELDANAKQWRLAADVANDAALLGDMLCGVAGARLFLPLAVASSALRAVVGVAGAATRAAIVAHQARAANVSDVAAKDGAQETLVNLAALAASAALLRLLDAMAAGAHDGWLLWTLFAAFVVAHLAANVAAVRAVAFRTLNAHRLVLATGAGVVRTPRQVAAREHLFPAWTHADTRRLLRRVRVGVAASRALAAEKTTPSTVLAQLAAQHYAVVHDAATDIYYVLLSTRATPTTVLRGVLAATARADVDVDALRRAGWRTDAALFGDEQWRVGVDDTKQD